jgi:hypothetical protein
MRKVCQKIKLNTVAKIDVDAMMIDLFPGLTSTNFNEIIPALLLATGRRTTEILKTATFTQIGAYRVMFGGHIKTDIGAYEIDLLAPASLCISALAWVRKNIDCTKMTTEQVNLAYSQKLNRAVTKSVKQKPHQLRGINAMACFQLYGKGEKSMMGYMNKQLGHLSEESTARYQTYDISVTRPWKVAGTEETKEIKEVKHEDMSGLVGNTVPERKKIAQIVEMMKAGKLVNNAHAVAQEYGGTYSMITRLLNMEPNANILAAYNKKWWENEKAKTK